ncbi:MAG TPA: hypothetical protein VKE51_27985 [Vicinamibacterales bacterium]|nr:hypothetical protein [Vicinamibacterales bacterium]
MRAIAYDLRLLQIDRLGLTGALETMMTTVAESSGVEMTASIDSLDGALHTTRRFSSTGSCRSA